MQKAHTASRYAAKRSSWFIQEITMTIEKTIATPPSDSMAMFRRLGRMSLFFATAGFACPNVFVENIDIANIDAAHKLRTQKA